MSATTARVMKKQRVKCPDCGWAGGRSAVDPLALPCFGCGGPVVPDGDEFNELRVLVGCRSCGGYWSRSRRADLGLDDWSPQCRRCEVPASEIVGLVDSDGVVIDLAGGPGG